MQDDLNIKNSEAIILFRNRLKAAYDHREQIIRETELEARAVLDQVQDRLSHWTQVVSHFRSLLDKSCMHEEADCSNLEFQLLDAQEKCDECRRCVDDIETARMEFSSRARYYERTTQDILTPALSFLDDLVSMHDELLRLASIANYVLAKQFPGAARSFSRYHARKQEIELVQRTGQGTRNWSQAELILLKRGKFPRGYHAHHIRSLQRFPQYGFDPDNNKFFTPAEHLHIGHQDDFHNASYGKLFNRRSLMIQRNKHKISSK